MHNNNQWKILIPCGKSYVMKSRWHSICSPHCTFSWDLATKVSDSNLKDKILLSSKIWTQMSKHVDYLHSWKAHDILIILRIEKNQTNIYASTLNLTTTCDEYGKIFFLTKQKLACEIGCLIIARQHCLKNILTTLLSVIPSLNVIRVN